MAGVYQNGGARDPGDCDDTGFDGCQDSDRISVYTARMKKQILYVGDTALREAASYLAGIMQHFGIEFDYVPSDQPFPGLGGVEYSGVILSDYPSKNFTPAQLDDLAAHVKDGLGLLMIGGWESYTGFGGDYGLTVLRDVLPVEMSAADDRVNCAQPCLVELRANHPVVAGLPFDQVCPGIGGYNRIKAKQGALEVLAAQQFRVERNAGAYLFVAGTKDPLLVVGEYGNGRVSAFATDVAPHWVGGLVDWGPGRVSACGAGANPIEVGNWYAQFFHQMVEWTARI
jgi:uncharacterized membrane protein